MSKNVTVIGVGRLGLGLALLIEKGGYNVRGVDIFPDYVKCLNDKTYKTKEPEYEKLLQNSKNFHSTTSLEEGLRFSNIIFIVVQTPNGGGKRFYDHTILSNLLVKINKHKVKNKDIIIGCTVMPKYINEIGKTLIEDCENTTLNYNPEFIAQGEIIKGFLYPDIILIGTENESLGAKLKKIYSTFILSNPKYCILTPLEAELVKITINGFITTKLSFANMISDVCDECGADKNKVLNSVGSDSRIGNKYFRPGYSFGGPCFPRDTKALKQFVDKQQINSDLLKATTKYNEEHVKYQTNQLLKENPAKEEFEFVDICYKEKSKIPIIEESAKLKIAANLARMGKRVIIKDEVQLINECKKEYGLIFSYETINKF
jgi:UDPglucose 6-dehydrogenase